MRRLSPTDSNLVSPYSLYLHRVTVRMYFTEMKGGPTGNADAITEFHGVLSDGRTETASHSFMPEAPGNAAVTEGLHASSYIPESKPRAAAKHEPGSEHNYLPDAGAAPEQSLRKKHSPQGSEGELSQAKAAYTVPEPKQTGLRQSLSKLAHR